MNPIAIINLKNLRNNIRYIKSKIQSSGIISIIKANAYGHGYVEILKVLKSEKVKCVGVATITELKEVVKTKSKLDILHLGKIDFNKIEHYLDETVIATINTYQDVTLLKSKLKKYQKIRVHIKVDTGMCRMGCDPIDFMKIIKEISRSPNIIIEGVYSHLACSEDSDSQNNIDQIIIFKDMLNKIKTRNLKVHLVNSGGIINYKDCYFDFVRVGLSMYGISSGIINENLKPVMELVAPVVLIKDVLKGNKIGYGCTYVVKEKKKIAILQCGYADGIPYNFGNRGYVFFKKQKLPILGKISMDLMCIDCTKVKNIKEAHRKKYALIYRVN